MTGPEDGALAGRVEDLEARLARLAQELDDIRTTENTTDTAARDGSEGWEPAYPSLLDWVQLWFLHHVERGRARWCDQWADHPEALWRLEALWRSFEQARLDPWSGPSTWTTSHLDPHLSVLLADHGPFGSCSPGLCGNARRIDRRP